MSDITTPAVAAPERWITIRGYTNIMYTIGMWPNNKLDQTRPLTEELIDGWMADCAAHGVTAVVWQPHCGGTASTHPGPVLPLPDPSATGNHETFKDWWTALAENVRRFDTLDAVIAAAHRHGLRLVYTICPWDFVDYTDDPAANVFADTWMRSRDGEGHVGVPCFAEPRARELLLKHVCYVLDRGVDDLAVTFFTHAQSTGTDEPDYYGFNTPVVEAYKARHGVDPLKEAPDPDRWHALHGEFYTDLLRSLHAETSRRGQRLIPCTTHDGHWGWGGSGGAAVWDYYQDGGSAPEILPASPTQCQWQTWADQGIADALLVSAPLADAVAHAQKLRTGSKLPVLIWRKVNPGIGPELISAYTDEARAAAAGDLDGYAVHAMFIWLLGKTEFDHYPPLLWSLVDAATRR